MHTKFIWKIENFSCLKTGRIRNSFHCFSNNWELIINPFSTFGYIRIELKLRSPRRYLNCFLNSSIALLDCEGSPLIWRETKNISMGKSNQDTTKFYHIKRDTIFGSMRNEFLPNDTLRVQCLIWETPEGLLNPASLFQCSRIELYEEVIKKTFHWNITNISSLRLDQTREHVELFTSEGDAVLLTNRGDVLKIRLFLGTSLSVKLSVSLDRAQVKCVVSVLDVKGKIIQFANEEYDFHDADEMWTFGIPITKDMLEHYRNIFLPNDTLSLVFECTLKARTICNEVIVREGDIFVNNSLSNVPLPLTPAPTMSSDEPKNKQLNSPDSTISRALMGILEEGFMSDFSFRVQDKTFPVHKAILSARSSVFRAMFTVDMKEKESSSVDIPDMDADTFQRMLNFIYSDTVEEDMRWNSASKLYSVADKYALEPLKQKCSRLLKRGLCVSSVLDVLLLGDTHQDDDLSAAALDFLTMNDKEIVATERWSNFAAENVLLAFDTLQKLYVKKMSV